MGETRHSKVLIVGSGPAGYTAAVYASRAMLAPVLIQGIQPGGQLTITTEVENWPGDTEVMGPALMERMEAHARAMGADIVQDHIASLDLDARPFRAEADSGTTYTADALILATGAQAKWLGLPSEEQFGGFGVSACATCDGFFYRGKEVVVVGGGNTAVEEALYLSGLASKVTLVHRRDSLRAEKILQERLFAKDNVEILWDTTLEEIVGDTVPMPNVTGARLKHAKTGEEHVLPVHGVFIAIGHKPATEVFAGHVERNDGGYIITAPDSTRTNVPGVFAAGDVSDETYRQAVTAAGLGCMAALEAEKWLAAKEALGPDGAEANVAEKLSSDLERKAEDIEQLDRAI